MSDPYIPRSILITGGGIVGGTLAVDYARVFPNTKISIYEISPTACEELRLALAERDVHNVEIFHDKEILKRTAESADVVDHCVPIDKMGEVQQAIRPHLPEGCVITNRGSAQKFSKEQIAPHVREGTFHFGLHPVVGRERKAGAPLEIQGTFKDQTGIIEYLPEDADPAARAAHDKLVSINKQVGFDIKALPVELHDRLLGAASHENTGALQNLVNTTKNIQTGLGATLMRAASGTTAMWTPIFTFNAAAINGASEIQQNKMNILLQSLNKGDRTAVLALVKEAHEFRMSWPDRDVQIESLKGERATLKERSGDEANQLASPLFFSIARTLGFKQVTDEIEPELKKYGHGFRDLLNSSIKDSTLGAKYNPEQITDMLMENAQGIAVNMALYKIGYQGFQGVVADLKINPAAVAKLHQHIQGAAEILADPLKPAPRRVGGGAGFEPFVKSITPGVLEPLEP